MIKALVIIIEWIGQVNPVFRAALALATVLLAFLSSINERWAQLFLSVDALVIPVFQEVADFSPLGLVNYCFPLDTVLSMIVAIAALKTACAAIRVLKSFVPTVA